VKTYLKESPGKGIGLFAAEPIKKGTIIFKEDEFTIKYLPDEYHKLTDEQKKYVGNKAYFLYDYMNESQKEFIKKYSYNYFGIYCLSMDNDRFTNHSDKPNTIEIDEYSTIASKNIKKDDEITTNYKNLNCEMDF
jgi:hypothetical protein